MDKELGGPGGAGAAASGGGSGGTEGAVDQQPRAEPPPPALPRWHRRLCPAGGLRPLCGRAATPARAGRGDRFRSGV